MILLFAAGLESTMVSWCPSQTDASLDLPIPRVSGRLETIIDHLWLPFAGQQLPACAVFSTNPPEPDVSTI